jgi:RNase P subunit RPR2
MQLGDYIDDYCSRCKRGTDHAVVSMEGQDVRMVRCRTCGFEHKYRHNKSGKKELTAEEAFQTLLASAAGQMGGGTAAAPKKKARKRA